MRRWSLFLFVLLASMALSGEATAALRISLVVPPSITSESECGDYGLYTLSRTENTIFIKAV